MFLPGLLFAGLFDLYKRWLAAMRVTLAPMIAQILATGVHLPLCYLLAIRLEMGVRGLGLATSITKFNLLLVTIVYSKCSPQISCALQFPDRDSLRGWSEYLKVSLPSTIMICSEWWAFEVITVIAGTISIEAQTV
jgi:MATE family multidrug resistance protein